ncbi:tRNA_synt_2f domain-containing protein [Cephalotus follicularis]|uniref:glycine--tRNA ligase n=1 Tax=Cephalotus follicularis TaxID=3775 RepID=A0A1Q3AMR2_CEPFO|nr:tRNA_synt_2f domain-containing protein [Cephalotus follicularis]
MGAFEYAYWFGLIKVLSVNLPSTISKISFSKSMRWNSQETSPCSYVIKNNKVMFSRPIRWVMAIRGDVVVPFVFAGVSSGNVSFGLRNTPSATVVVENAESYAYVMRNAGISIDIEDQKEAILEHSHALAKSVNRHVIVQESLLDEVVNLVEAPVPILGKFKESLDLPKDLLTMVEHIDTSSNAPC